MLHQPVAEFKIVKRLEQIKLFHFGDRLQTQGRVRTIKTDLGITGRLSIVVNRMKKIGGVAQFGLAYFYAESIVDVFLHYFGRRTMPVRFHQGLTAQL